MSQREVIFPKTTEQIVKEYRSVPWAFDLRILYDCVQMPHEDQIAFMASYLL